MTDLIKYATIALAEFGVILEATDTLEVRFDRYPYDKDLVDLVVTDTITNSRIVYTCYDISIGDFIDDDDYDD